MKSYRIFRLKCTECNIIFSGNTKGEAEKEFKKYHESIKKTGSPLWIIDSKNIMYGTRTAAEVKKEKKEYIDRNLNESNGEIDDDIA
jgi:hypothetical protein